MYTTKLTHLWLDLQKGTLLPENTALKILIKIFMLIKLPLLTLRTLFPCGLTCHTHSVSCMCSDVGSNILTSAACHEWACLNLAGRPLLSLKEVFPCLLQSSQSSQNNHQPGVCGYLGTHAWDVEIREQGLREHYCDHDKHPKRKQVMDM